MWSYPAKEYGWHSVNTESGVRRTVYIVDDDASTRRALARLLIAAGFNATAFESAEAFLEASACDDDACVLVDVYMHGMNGIELCRRLATTGRKLPTILMTAHSDPRTRQLAERTESDRNPTYSPRCKLNRQ